MQLVSTANIIQSSSRIGLPVVIGAVAIGPANVVSDLSKWPYQTYLSGMLNQLFDKAADQRIVAVTLMIIILCAVWLFSRFVRNRKVAEANEVPTPPIRSLQYRHASLEISMSQSRREFSGFLIIELQNTTDKIISFRATTMGRINGIVFDTRKDSLNGYAYPHQKSYLVSRQFTEIPLTIREKGNIELCGIYEYKLVYRYVGAKSFQRKTARGITINMCEPFIDNSFDLKDGKGTTVSTYFQIDE